MKHLKNEQGAALVLTIMIITLILLFALTLSYQVLNTTKQVDTSEKNIDARSIAEMGVTYYQTFVEEQIEQKELDEACNFEPPQPGEMPEKPSIGVNRSFEIKKIKKTCINEDMVKTTETFDNDDGNDDNDDNDDDDNDNDDDNDDNDDDDGNNDDDSDNEEFNKLLINFESVGTSYGKSATVQGTIKIKSPEND